MNLTSDDRVSLAPLYGGDYISHGILWKRHKYIRKEGNRYIYPEDIKRRPRATSGERVDPNQNNQGATLFGSRELRQLASSTRRQMRRYEGNLERTDREIARRSERYRQAVARADDPTASRFIRAINRGIAQRQADAIHRLTTDRVASQTAYDNGKELYERTMRELNASRTIDDIPRNVVETGQRIASWFANLIAR